MSRYEELYDVAVRGYRQAVVQKNRANQRGWKRRLEWLDRMLAKEGK